jgi:hypothetical protein
MVDKPIGNSVLTGAEELAQRFSHDIYAAHREYSAKSRRTETPTAHSRLFSIIVMLRTFLDETCSALQRSI